MSPWVEDVLSFWFEELESADWFKKSDATDNKIRFRFLTIHETVAGMATAELVTDERTALAAIIVLDQFPRNMFRGSPKSFATDGKALEIARAFAGSGFGEGLSIDARVFAYLPFEHSENLADQHRAVELIGALGNDEYTRYAVAHRDVIERFGRFPHRNAVLGRVSTPEEEAYLAEPGSGF